MDMAGWGADCDWVVESEARTTAAASAEAKVRGEAEAFIGLCASGPSETLSEGG